MSEKCKKTKSGALEFCESMQQAWSEGYVERQHLRNNETGKRRERIALVNKKISFPFPYCPWCRANIDTTPTQRADQAAQGGES